MKKPVWIKEEEAAAILNYRPRHLRRLVKSGKLEIAFSAPRNRNFQYNKIDIDKVQLQHSNFMS